jgi:hypothetical protein
MKLVANALDGTDTISGKLAQTDNNLSTKLTLLGNTWDVGFKEFLTRIE